MEWSGMEGMEEKIHCLEFLKLDGKGWNQVVYIPSYATHSPHFCSPQIGWNGMELKRLDFFTRIFSSLCRHQLVEGEAHEKQYISFPHSYCKLLKGEYF